MSGVLLPLMHPTGTIGGAGDPVGIDDISTMTRVTAVSAPGVNTSDKFQLIFAMKGHQNNAREVVWSYEDQAALDTSYDAILTLLSNAIA